MDLSTGIQSRTHRRISWIGLIEIVLAFSLAGSSLVVAKILSVSVPIFLTGFLSLIVAFICMLPMQIKKRWELKRLNQRELLLMLLQALFGIVLFRVFTLYGLRYTSAANAAVITAATPAVMALFSLLFLKERLRLHTAFGVSAALAALVIINLDQVSQVGNQGSWLGNLLIGMAVISEVMLTIFRKLTRTGISSITNTTMLTLIAIVLMMPFALLELKAFSLGHITGRDWLAIIYYGAIATSAAYILWGSGALKIPATYTGVACVAMPVSALLLSGIVLGEILTLYHILGCSLAVIGIVICNSRH
jgi:drug/metabolite transporter (DMT)-like permease